MLSGKVKIEKSNDVFYIHNQVKKPVEVVFLHGRNHNAKVWQDTGSLKILADNGYSAISINLPTYLGKAGYETDLLPHVWLRAVYDKLRIDNPILVCASAGSDCALPFLTRFPRRVKGFVAVGAANLKDFRKAYPKLSVPVLAVWGENDNVISSQDGKIFADQVPMGEFRELSDAGHAVHVDQPEQFNELLLEFVMNNS